LVPLTRTLFSGSSVCYRFVIRPDKDVAQMMLIPLTKATATRPDSGDSSIMNSSNPTLATSSEHDRQACDDERPPVRRATAVNALTHILRLAVLAAGLICHGPSVFAESRIEVGFEADAADSQKLIHAKAEFAVPRPVVYDVFNRVTSYPMLHDWIRETTLVSADEDSQEFMVEFAFPWPVGRQWSRVEVQHSGNSIFWRQLEGSLKANHGRISFTTEDSMVHIDYRAAIDIGLPELLTQSYKEKFVREFLTAAYEQARIADSPPALALAAEP
jgi:uncharacterized membrane protein